MKLDELIEKLKEQQDAGYGDYRVIVDCYDDFMEQYTIDCVDIDHKSKEILL